MLLLIKSISFWSPMTHSGHKKYVPTHRNVWNTHNSVLTRKLHIFWYGREWFSGSVTCSSILLGKCMWFQNEGGEWVKTFSSPTPPSPLLNGTALSKYFMYSCISLKPVWTTVKLICYDIIHIIFYFQCHSRSGFYNILDKHSVNCNRNIDNPQRSANI